MLLKSNESINHSPQLHFDDHLRLKQKIVKSFGPRETFRMDLLQMEQIKWWMEPLCDSKEKIKKAFQ